MADDLDAEAELLLAELERVAAIPVVRLGADGVCPACRLRWLDGRAECVHMFVRGDPVEEPTR